MTNLTDTLTGREIAAQPEAWAGALRTAHEHRAAIRQVMRGPALFCGCGTSYYIAMAAARVYQEVTGLPARAVAASELFLAPFGVLERGHSGPLVAISRSGETTETVLAARFYKDGGHGPVVSVTAQADSALGQTGDMTLTLPWADDRSVVMTRSFTTLLLACWAMAAVVADDQGYWSELNRLPGLAPDAIQQAAPLARRLGEEISLDQFMFLGLGPYEGLALEGMLKLKEMTQVAAEAYPPLEFRHGPISVVTDRTAAVLLASERGAEYHGQLLADIRRLGGKTVALGHPLEGLPADQLLSLGDGLSDRSRGLLYLPFLQQLGLNRALALGINPDQPRNLNRVVTLQEGQP